MSDNENDEQGTVRDLFAKRENVLTVLPDIEEVEARQGDLTWEDLEFLAERLLLGALAKVDWADMLKEGAEIVSVDEEDAKDIVRLIKGAEFEVRLGSDLQR